MVAPLMPFSPEDINPPAETQPDLGDSKTQKALNIAIFNPLVSGLAIMMLLPIGLQTGQWQYNALSIALLFVFLTSLLAIRWIRMKRVWLGMLVMTVAWQLAWVTLAGTVEGLGLAVGGIVLLVTVMVAAETLESRQSSSFIILGLFAAIVSLLINTYLVQVPKLAVPALTSSFPYILVGILVVYLFLIVDRFSSYNLQIKLVTIFFAIVLIPLTIVSYLFNDALTKAVTRDASQMLQMGARQVASEIDNFLYSTLTVLRTDSANRVLSEYLELDPNQREKSALHQETLLFLASLENRDRLNIDTYALVDSRGTVLLDTQPENNGVNESSESYFLETGSQGRATVSSVEFSQLTGKPLLTFASPVRNHSGTMVGFLRLRYDAAILQQILNRYIAFIGPRSYPILLDENSIRLADAATPENIYKFAANLTPNDVRQLQILNRLKSDPLEEMKVEDDQLILSIQSNNPFFEEEIHPAGGHIESGSFSRLKNVPWIAVFVQDQEVYLTPIEQELRTLVMIVVLIATLVAVVAITTAYVLSRPIIELTKTAQTISTGDLTVRARVRSEDEIGVLGKAFNGMTAQLQQLVTGLEERVTERTQALAEQTERMRYRATQLQTVADVAAAVASVSDLDTLLTSVTTLISERFGYYHAGIFLLDERAEYADLKAANSDGGQRMLARNHRLKVGQVGIVGYVTGTGQPRIASDVGEDAVFFNNPDLPETRSEMAIPLKIGEKIIGALDVQSQETMAFSEENIALFTTLSDQVAIAIQNNRLFAETSQALQESQDIHRRYLRQEWGRELAERGPRTIRYNQKGIKPSETLQLPEIQNALSTGVVSAHFDEPSQAGEQRSALAVPIKLRGEVIGVIDLQETDRFRRWTEDEIAAVQSVADQVALALENARLFEQTVRRADRERKVLDISSKIRATSDPQAMIQTALKELQRTLNASRAQILLKSDGPAREDLHEDQPQASLVHTVGLDESGSNGFHPNDPDEGAVADF